jgi:cell division protein FtsZ
MIKNKVQEIVSNEQKLEEISAEVNQILNAAENTLMNEVADMEDTELKIEKHIQRIKELKNLNVTINSPDGIRDLEKEPAYKRRNKKLNDVPHSSETQISRLTLFEDPSKNATEIRTNNSFLHDNVD